MTTVKNTCIEKTYFRNNPKYGRTTTLLSADGKTLAVYMGSLSHRDAVAGLTSMEVAAL